MRSNKFCEIACRRLPFNYALHIVLKLGKLKNLMETEIYEKITQKKEFSQLPKKDVEMAFSRFEKRQASDEEKVKLTRDLLRKIFSAFASQKILSPKNKSEEWILRKHLSTRERLPFYEEVYGRILKKEKKDITVIDLGAGVNGFSHKFLREIGEQINYVGVEAVGQLVDLTNSFFKREKINGKVYHKSLFDLNEIKKIILKQKKPRIVFLLKTIDSLEMLEKDYSKKLLLEITPLCDKVVVSFATGSMIKKTKFKAKRNWILDFIKGNFEPLDNFEIGNEKYIVFSHR